MTTNYRTTGETTRETTCALTAEIATDIELVAVLGLLAATGVGAEVVFDGSAQGCPHCASQVLSEAA